MPHSLRSRIKKFHHQGLLSDKDRDRILNALDYEWIPIKTRELTEEEKKHFEEQLEMEVNEIICSPLPEDGQEVLITMYDRVYLDTFCDDWYGSSFENADIEDVKAWKPLPEPYKESLDAED